LSFKRKEREIHLSIRKKLKKTFVNAHMTHKIILAAGKSIKK
jgi:hypothetical protein